MTNTASILLQSDYLDRG